MAKYLLLTLFILITRIGYSQSESDSLVMVGVGYHDEGDYETAIRYYKKALKLDPENDLIWYELAFSYMENEQYSKCVFYADKILDTENSSHRLLAFVIKGSALDYLNRKEESIEVFKQGLEEFGESNLLCYNLALVYNAEEKFESALPYFERSLQLKPFHASSSYMLCFTNYELKKKPESNLAGLFFLLLEPNTERSETTWNILEENFTHNIVVDEKGKSTIYMDVNDTSSEYKSTEILNSLLTAYSEGSEDKTDYENFKSRVDNFLLVMANEEGKRDDVYSIYYIDTLLEIRNSEHFETYLRYISGTYIEESKDWLENNEEKVNAFFKWLNQ